MTILLSACGAHSSGSLETRKLLLPEVKKYTPEQQSTLADEIEQCDVPTATVLLKDYDTMQRETTIAGRKLDRTRD